MAACLVSPGSLCAHVCVTRWGVGGASCLSCVGSSCGATQVHMKRGGVGLVGVGSLLGYFVMFASWTLCCKALLLIEVWWKAPECTTVLHSITQLRELQVVEDLERDLALVRAEAAKDLRDRWRALANMGAAEAQYVLLVRAFGPMMC